MAAISVSSISSMHFDNDYHHSCVWHSNVQLIQTQNIINTQLLRQNDVLTWWLRVYYVVCLLGIYVHGSSFAVVSYFGFTHILQGYFISPHVSKASLQNIIRCMIRIQINWWYNHDKTQHNNIVRIFRETYSTKDTLNQSQIISIRQVALSQDLAKFISKTPKIACPISRDPAPPNFRTIKLQTSLPWPSKLHKASSFNSLGPRAVYMSQQT